MLALLAVLVCALTALVVNRALGGGSGSDSSTVAQVVRIVPPAQPGRRQPGKPSKAKQDREEPAQPLNIGPHGDEKTSLSTHESEKASPMPPATRTPRPR